MGRQRQLEAAAETGAGDRGNNRLGASLDLVDELTQSRIGAARGRAELPDVGAAGEQTSRAGEDDRADVGIEPGALEGLSQPGADGVREAVDRRVREGDDRHAAVQPKVDVGHAKTISRPGVPS